MARPKFTLIPDGDYYEQRFWAAFARELLPSYERFWRARIVPLTYREDDRTNVRFRTALELAQRGFGDEDVTVAQLHYTLLLHLGRTWELLNELDFDRFVFFEVFVRLSGVSDIADELLQRRATPGVYDPWNERAGSWARTQFRKNNGDALRDLRAYRNRLVHGRVVPEFTVTLQGDGVAEETMLTFPRVDKVDDYLDWRRAFAEGKAREVLLDFASGQHIAREQWHRVTQHVDAQWRLHLGSDLAKP